MYGFAYTIQLLEPLLANNLAGDANSAQSLPYVPGALIRGSLIRAYQEQHNLSAIDAADNNLRRLFFDGQTRYLNAYPLVYGEDRALPAPLAWHKWKNLQPEFEQQQERVIFDLSVNPNERRIQTRFDKEDQVDGLGDGRFCSIKGEVAYWSERPENINVHTQRDAVVGRAQEGRGAIFRYEALSMGYRLKGIILTSTTEDAQALKSLMEGRTLVIGKSRTAGYGLAKVEETNDISSDWNEADNQLASYEYLPTGYEEKSEEEEDIGYTALPPSLLTTFTLIFLSDAIVRDDDGQHTLNPIPALKRLLDDESANYELTIDEERSFRKANIVGGFNRKWGLPLPQVAAIAASSTFVIRTSPSIEVGKLADLQRSGIGERRLDGFGRLVINWYNEPPHHWLKDQEDNYQLGLSTYVEEERQLTDAEKNVAQMMLTRLLRRDLDRSLLEAIHNLQVQGDIPNSQLSRWRGVVYSALNEESPVRQVGRLTEFLTSEEEKSSVAWQRLHRARVIRGKDEDKGRLTEWMRRVLTTEGSPWDWLTTDKSLLKRSLGHVTVMPDLKVAVEYRLRLIDGVLARTAKENARRSSRGKGER